MRKNDSSEYKKYLTDENGFTFKKALSILGVIAVIFAAATLGFVISLQRGEDHAAIGGAIRENSGLKLRIEELEAENEELQKEIDKLQAEVEKQKNKADDAGNEADAEADESEDGSDEGTDEEVRAGY